MPSSQSNVLTSTVLKVLIDKLHFLSMKYEFFVCRPRKMQFFLSRLLLCGEAHFTLCSKGWEESTLVLTRRWEVATCSGKILTKKPLVMAKQFARLVSAIPFSRTSVCLKHVGFSNSPPWTAASQIKHLITFCSISTILVRIQVWRNSFRFYSFSEPTLEATRGSLPPT